MWPHLFLFFNSFSKELYSSKFIENTTNHLDLVIVTSLVLRKMTFLLCRMDATAVSMLSRSRDFRSAILQENSFFKNLVGLLMKVNFVQLPFNT